MTTDAKTMAKAKLALDRRALPLCKKWVRILRLSDWDISYAVDDLEGYDESTEAACTASLYRGHQAKISFRPAPLIENDGEELEFQICHEHVHLFVEELAGWLTWVLPKRYRETFTLLLETTVSDIARLAIRLQEEE